MLIRLSLLAAALIILGYLASYWLMRSKHQTLRHSELETKIVFWIPIYLLLIAFAYGNTIIKELIAVLIIAGIWADAWRYLKRPSKRRIVSVYALGMTLTIGLAWLLAAADTTIFLAACLTSILSDVLAFFAGKTIGRHNLPERINARKSWEGVAGQLIGAVIGIILFNIFIADAPLWIAVAVGLASAGGDLLNSFIKRLLGIKDWSKRVPGHGGIIDRLSSLSPALALTWLVLYITTK